MEIITLCQSCGIPLDNDAIKGTKKNGLKSEEYCKFCYELGGFTDPNLTLAQIMETSEMQMKKLKLPDAAIQEALDILPTLSRWKGNENLF